MVHAAQELPEVTVLKVTKGGNVIALSFDFADAPQLCRPAARTIAEQFAGRSQGIGSGDVTIENDDSEVVVLLKQPTFPYALLMLNSLLDAIGRMDSFEPKHVTKSWEELGAAGPNPVQIMDALRAMRDQ